MLCAVAEGSVVVDLGPELEVEAIFVAISVELVVRLDPACAESDSEP